MTYNVEEAKKGRNQWTLPRAPGALLVRFALASSPLSFEVR